MSTRLNGISGNVRPRIESITYSVECGMRGETYEIIVRPGDVPGVASIELPVMEMEGDEMDAFLDIMTRIRAWHCMPEAKGE